LLLVIYERHFADDENNLAIVIWESIYRSDSFSIRNIGAFLYFLWSNLV